MRLVCSCCGKKTESTSFSGYGGGSCEYSSEGVHIFIKDSTRYVCCYCGQESGGYDFGERCSYSPSGYHKLINGR